MRGAAESTCNLVGILGENVLPVRADDDVFQRRIDRLLQSKRGEPRRGGDDGVDAPLLDSLLKGPEALTIRGACFAATSGKRGDKLICHAHAQTDEGRQVKNVGEEIAGETAVVIDAIEKSGEGLRIIVGLDHGVHPDAVSKQLVALLFRRAKKRVVVGRHIQHALKLVKHVGAVTEFLYMQELLHAARDRGGRMVDINPADFLRKHCGKLVLIARIHDQFAADVDMSACQREGAQIGRLEDAKCVLDGCGRELFQEPLPDFVKVGAFIGRQQCVARLDHLGLCFAEPLLLSIGENVGPFYAKSGQEQRANRLDSSGAVRKHQEKQKDREFPLHSKVLHKSSSGSYGNSQH